MIIRNILFFLAALISATGFYYYPVNSIVTRMGLLLSIAFILVWPAYLLRRKKRKLVIYIICLLLPFTWLCLPGPPCDPDKLRCLYLENLTNYRGAPYWWGGENDLGIDCSGLLRRARMDALTQLALEDKNPALIRRALENWWFDMSAAAMRDMYRSRTRRICTAPSINDLDHWQILPGDMAVTADGIHVMAFLGNRTWIEADPESGKVIIVKVIAEGEGAHTRGEPLSRLGAISSRHNTWFGVPVHLLRWSDFPDSPPRGYRDYTPGRSK
ncbi:MAG: C40 family peptidase [bacterium]|nr:C40 family peptidase [bacterium]